MATQLKKTVKPSGGDYTSLEACMNDNEQDLVTADKYFDVEISGEWSSADTTAVVVHNYTTDATRYVNIYTTGDARHDGTWGGYRLVVSGPPSASITTRGTFDIIIDGLCIEKTEGNSNRSVIFLSDYEVSRATVKNCIITSVPTDSYSTNRRGIRATNVSGGSSIKIFNNIIYDIYRSDVGGDGIVATGIIYNNTVVGCSRGIVSSGTIKNNLAYDNISADYSASGTTSNNLSSDDTSPDEDYREKTITFTDADGKDFSLASTDTDAIDKGADLGSDYDEDIIGTARPQGSAWDIGAFEYISATIKRRLLMGCGV